MVKKVLSIILWVITAGAIVVLFVFGRKTYLDTPLKGIGFSLEQSSKRGCVEKDTMLSHIEQLCDLEHQAKISSIDMMKLKKMLISNPWIEQAGGYIGLNDTLVIKAKEHKPVVRIFNKQGRSVFVTEHGTIIPFSPKHTPRLIIANGDFDFPTPRDNADMNDSIYAGVPEALHIAQAINNNPFLMGNIGQICKTGDEYELVVNNLSARVIFGDTCATNDKMQRLRTLLEKYSGTSELEPYKTLNLKYKNQIVCTK